MRPLGASLRSALADSMEPVMLRHTKSEPGAVATGSGTLTHNSR